MDKIGIFDFGGQYCHLIARRIRDLGVYADIIYESSDEYKGFILSGGPGEVYADQAPKLPEDFFLNVKVPVLGICYGHQMIAQALGGEVEKGEEREYGKKIAELDTSSQLFVNLERREQVWMSHFDQVIKLPDNYEIIGKTDICSIAAYQNLEKNVASMHRWPSPVS